MGGEKPAAFSGDKFTHPDKPVVNVSWAYAQKFLCIARHSRVLLSAIRSLEDEFTIEALGNDGLYEVFKQKNTIGIYATLKL